MIANADHSIPYNLELEQAFHDGRIRLLKLQDFAEQTNLALQGQGVLSGPAENKNKC